MKKRILRADLLFLLTSAIWGLAFVAQRVGMDYMGPLAFNFVRFGLGSLVLVPLLWRQKRKGLIPRCDRKEIILGGVLASMFLMLASTLQQVGMVSTEAGKAGFITGLYVILVPFLGLFLGQKVGWKTWLGAVLAVVGLYFLSVTTKFTIRRGDLYILISAVAWAFHVQTIGRF
ncbi:MAG: DMT family transporter, partial [Chloroflexota bacterium]|nr:DMT family transporter [Chloroflexota bacterium]